MLRPPVLSYNSATYTSLQSSSFQMKLGFKNEADEYVVYDMDNIVSFTQEGIGQYSITIRLTEANAKDMLFLNNSGKILRIVEPGFYDATGTKLYSVNIPEKAVVTDAHMKSLGASVGPAYLLIRAASMTQIN